MYVWVAFETKSPPTRQDLVTLNNNYTLYVGCSNRSVIGTKLWDVFLKKKINAYVIDSYLFEFLETTHYTHSLMLQGRPRLPLL